MKATRKIAAVVMSVLLPLGVFLSAPASTVVAAGGEAALSGSGTQADPYQIGTEAELDQMAQQINSDSATWASKYYQLAADISLTSQFTPISTFSGQLDGAGHTISGLTIDASLVRAAFIDTNSGTIENLGFANVSIPGKTSFTTTDSSEQNWKRGTIAVVNNGTIQGCYVKGSLSGGWRVGGLTAENNATIRSSYAVVNVNGNWETGGISAWTSSTGVIDSCYVVPTVYANVQNTGGITAYAYTGSVIKNSAVLSGSIASGNKTTSARISGRNNSAPTFQNNIASATLTVQGAVVTDGTATNLNGLNKTDEELAQQATYEALGWDFTNVWKMDAALGRPTLKACPEAQGTGDTFTASYTEQSPDGGIVATVYTDQNYRLGYKVSYKGTDVILDSQLGLVVGGVNLGENVFLSDPERTSADTTYATRGMHTTAEDNHNDMLVPVTGRASGKSMKIEMRVFNDGIAFRYVLPDNTTVTVSDETTYYTIPEDAKAFYQIGDTGAYDNIENMQSKSSESSVADVPQGRLLTMLPTFELANKAAYVCLAQANVYNWAGIGLRVEGDGSFKTEYFDSPTFTSDRGGSAWRVAIISSDLTQFVNSDIVTNVSDPEKTDLFPDTSYIKPGRSVWITQGGGTPTPEETKLYSDYASQLGIEYNLIEQHSAANGWGATLQDQFDTIKQIVDYSKPLGVDIWLWEDAPTGDFPGGLYNEASRTQFLDMCKAAGVVGVKIDHVQSQTPDKVSFYEDFLKEAAARQIMVSYHNPMEPTGLSRTYPNEITREAIRGMQNTCDPDDTTILPFTRLLAGGADYTPLNFSNSSRLGNATWTNMLANTVIMTSAYLQISENPQNLVEQYGVIDDFIKKVPSVWDETRVLPQTEVGDDAAFLRRSGDDWYLAVQNSTKGTKNMTFDLSFLGSGTYYADTYYDNMSKKADIKRKVVQVTSADSLTAQINTGGGYVVRLTKDPVSYTPPDDESQTYDITTQADLDLIRQHPQSSFELKNDIQLTGQFTPIPELDGNFNGNGHTISGLTVDPTANTPRAAFILKNYGTIRDVGFTDVSIDGPYTADNSWRAAICVENHGTVEESYALGTVKGGHRDGGLVAENYATIRNSYFIGTLESNFETGGITSWNVNGTALVENCYASGDFKSRGHNIGTIGGYAYSGTTFSGDVALGGSLQEGTSGYAARICGRNNGTATYTNNLANTNLLVEGKKVTGSLTDLNGLDKTPDDLKQAATYVSIGWDFTGVWKMSDVLGRPVLVNNEEAEIPPVTPAATIKDISLNIGADQTQRNVVWYSDSASAGKVQLAPKSAMTGTDFPAAHLEFSAVSGATNVSGFNNNKATMTGLSANTEYVYRVGNDDGWSDVQSFKTQSFSGDFSFLFAGDPQIGSSGNAGNDTSGWNNTLNKSLAQFPQSSFLISAGDQVESAGDESLYDGYLSPSALTGITLAVNVGNHDVGGSGYTQHFNMPNLSTLGASTSAGAGSGDYWYVYNNTLFMSLNSNNTSVATHRQFLQDTIDAHGQGVKWKVVTFHHSIFSVASHAYDQPILQLRADLAPVLSQLGIDVVLMGHDHSYTRSYMMDGTTPVVPEGGVQSSVDNPAAGQVLYITANSASGSKFYALQNADFPFAAVKNQENVPNITKVSVTDTSFTITTYRVTDMSVVDTFTINHTAAVGTAPSITTTTLPAATAGTAYSQTLAATGDAPIAWSVASGSLPAGLTLSGDGVLSGTPTADGTFTFTVKAENAVGSATQDLSIQVSPAASTGTKPTITTAALPAATAGTAYSQTLAATGDAPITWSVAGGSLPAGLALSGSGVLSGTPTADGTFAFTVKAENAAGSATQDLRINVAAASRRLADAPTGVQLLLPQEALPDGVSLQDVRLEVEPVTSGTAFAQAQGALAPVGTKFSLFDIRLLVGNTPVEPTKPVQVSLPIPDGFDTAHLALYYIKDDGTAEPVTGGSVQGGLYVFMASHLSGYALVDTSSVSASSTPSSPSSGSPASASSAGSASNPATGVGTSAGAVIVLFGAAACAALLLVRRRKSGE